MPKAEGFSLEHLGKLIFLDEYFWYARKRYSYDDITSIHYSATQTEHKLNGFTTGTSYDSDLRLFFNNGTVLAIRPDVSWLRPQMKEKTEAIMRASNMFHEITFAKRIAPYEQQLSQKNFVQWGDHQISGNGDLFRYNEFVFNLHERMVSKNLGAFVVVFTKRKPPLKKFLTNTTNTQEFITISRDKDCFLYIMKYYVGVLWPHVEVRDKIGGGGQRQQSQQEKPKPAQVKKLHTQYLQVLGLRNGATLKEIKIAYRGLARRYHPDLLRAKGVVAEEITLSEEKLKTINIAYNWLSGNYNEKESGS